jgi:uncharacterized protein with PIN domain
VLSTELTTSVSRVPTLQLCALLFKGDEFGQTDLRPAV